MKELFMEADAEISECRKYRYKLSRSWDGSLSPLVYVMLNPSTADASEDDPTIRRCIGFARDYGFGGIEVVNLFAYRTAYPSELPRTLDAVGRENNDWITATCAGRVVVMAWGACERYAANRIDEVISLVQPIARDVVCLGYTKDFQPRHPLMLAKTTQRVPFLRKVASNPAL